jgi:hypothetical protein
MEDQRRLRGSGVILDATQQNGVISFLMPGIRRAFECRNAVTQPGATPDAVFELAFPACKFVECRAGKMFCQSTLRGGQDAQHEAATADKRVGAAGVVSNAPENERRVERDRCEGVYRHALALAAFRHGGDQAYSGGESSERLPKGSGVRGDGGVACDECPRIQGSPPGNLRSVLTLGGKAQQVLSNHGRYRIPVQGDVANDGV